MFWSESGLSKTLSRAQIYISDITSFCVFKHMLPLCQIRFTFTSMWKAYLPVFCVCEIYWNSIKMNLIKKMNFFTQKCIKQTTGHMFRMDHEVWNCLERHCNKREQKDCNHFSWLKLGISSRLLSSTERDLGKPFHYPREMFVLHTWRGFIIMLLDKKEPLNFERHFKARLTEHLAMEWPMRFF